MLSGYMILYGNKKNYSVVLDDFHSKDTYPY